MTINQALPLVSLSKVPKDPRAFGVISLTQDHPAGPSAAISGTELLKIAEQGDVRVQINSIGEGCIWVCDETGSTIHAGDYVTTSSLSGYASLQVRLDDDGDVVPDGTLRNYTVAKLTMDCDFSQPLVDVEEVQTDEYGNVVFDSDGSLVYTIVTTTQGPSVVDPDTGETRPGEPLETPIPVTGPSYKMRWMTTQLDASSGLLITTLISKEDYDKRAAQDHSAYVQNGELFVYGRNNYGQLGLGHTSNTITVPTKVPGINNASLVACGEGFTLCVRTDGSDANGQLGRGAFSANVVINSNIVPMLMPGGSNVPARSISAGGYHSAVLLNNGSAYLCGKNDQGQCGASTTLVPHANSLGIIPSLSNVVDVACGHEHTLFTCYDGQVLGVGRNDRGQLGQGNKTSPVTSVVQVLAGGGAGSKNGLSVEIAAGFNHSALIKNDNTIFVFGANDKGQLGSGETTTESLTPTQLVGYAGYNIACGRNHTVISTTPDPLVFNFTGNNALISFGDNAYGQVALSPVDITPKVN
eukprot:gene14894-biopygen23949